MVHEERRQEAAGLHDDRVPAVPSIEFADRRTWPVPLRRLAKSLADEGDGEELWDRDPAPFFEAIGDRSVRLYHCTRLTDRELNDVSSHGLRLLDPHFTAQRIRRAVDDGYLSPEEGAFYETSRCSRDPYRKGMLHLFADRRGLDRVSDTIHLLRIWGGEGINQAWSTRSEESRRLWRVGTPTVVVVAVDPRRADRCHPSWMSALVTGGGTHAIFTRDIPAANVVALEHPGGTFWERFVEWDGVIN